MTLLKIVLTEDWLCACASTEKLFFGGDIDKNDGYQHLSTPQQVLSTLTLFYKGKPPGSLTLVELDEAEYKKWLEAKGGKLVYENTYNPEKGDDPAFQFPHGYAGDGHPNALPCAAPVVRRTAAVCEQEDGSFTSDVL